MDDRLRNFMETTDTFASPSVQHLHGLRVYTTVTSVSRYKSYAYLAIQEVQNVCRTAYLIVFGKVCLCIVQHQTVARIDSARDAVFVPRLFAEIWSEVCLMANPGTRCDVKFVLVEEPSVVKGS